MVKHVLFYPTLGPFTYKLAFNMLRRNLSKVVVGVANLFFFASYLLSQGCSTVCGEIDEAGGPPVNFCAYPQTGCPPNLQEYEGCCCVDTPILIDAHGEGFHLTSVKEGVRMRTLPGGDPVQVSWTDPHWHNGWLVLDRNATAKLMILLSCSATLHSSPPVATPTDLLRSRYLMSRQAAATATDSSIPATPSTIASGFGSTRIMTA